jgi:hypothetical protein
VSIPLEDIGVGGGREVCRSEVPHDPVLGLDHGALLRAVGDLQDVAYAVSVGDEEVLVSFAGQHRRLADHAEQVAGESCRVGCGVARRVGYRRHRLRVTIVARAD